jgi:hypothetical protein
MTPRGEMWLILQGLPEVQMLLEVLLLLEQEQEQRGLQQQQQ